MRSSMDVSASPNRPSASSLPASGSDGSRGRGSLVAVVSETFKRVRTWRPGAQAGDAARRGPAAAAAGPEGGGAAAATATDSPVPRRRSPGEVAGGGPSPRFLRRRDTELPPSRRATSLVPRHSIGLRAGDVSSHTARSHVSSHTHTSGGSSGGNGSPSHGRKHGRSHHAVPVSTTRVQDGVKWVNLVRFVNLARLFTSCLRTRTRRRVRFSASPTQRGLMLSAGGAEGGKPTAADQAASGVGGAPGSPASARPVYIQVRQGRHLVWPSFEGVEHSCFCLLTVGGQLRGTTQAVTVAPTAGGGGGGGGPAAAAGYTVLWNEVFNLPRSCFEGAPDGRVVLEVWSTEQYGDDILVGQAELLLGPMLEAERPHPLSTVLELQAIDEETGQVEPGRCGELMVAAWVEPELENKTPRPYALPSRAQADLDEAGVVTSSLAAPCGSKSVPQVLHSPLGTLYEEPCVVALKISVVGLVDLSYDLLMSGGAQAAVSKRRVRLEACRSHSTVRDGREREVPERDRRRDSPATSGRVASSSGTNPSSRVPFASPSITRGMGAYLARVKRKRQHQRFLAQLQAARGGSLPGEGRQGGHTAGGTTAVVSPTGLGGCLPMLHLGVRGGRRARGQGLRGLPPAATTGGGAGGGGGSMDDLMDEDEDVTTAGVAGGGSGGPGGGGGGGGGNLDDKTTVTADDADDGSSLTLNPTLPLSGMTVEDAAAPGQGQGVFCYFKVSVDKQSDKSRLRWLPAPPSPPAGLSPQQQLQFLLDAARSVALHPSVFVFTMARPLRDVPVSLAMYVTSSARRRGRVVGRLTLQLYDLVDRVLSSVAGSTGRPAAQRPDMGVNGKVVEVVLPFEEELGAVRVFVQLADLDERAALFRLPLVTDPQQLISESLLGAAAGPCAFMAALLPGDAVSVAGGPNGAEGDGRGPRHARVLGPVLSDTDLLLKVLKRSAVEDDVEGWFMSSFARVGQLKVAGGGSLPGPVSPWRTNTLASALGSAIALGGGTGGAAAATAAGGMPMSRSGRLDPLRLFNKAVTAAAGFSITGNDTDPDAADVAAAAGNVLSSLFRNPDGFSFTDAMSTLDHSPGGSFAGRGDGDGGGGGRPAGAAGGSSSRVLGSLVLRIASINTSGALAGATCCCIVKCGPHWLRTVDWGPPADGRGMPQWQVIIPIYSPATILTVGIFTSSAKSVMGLTFSDNLGLVSRVRLKLCRVRPFRRSWHIVAMYMNGSPAASPGGAPLVAVLGLKMQYSGVGALAVSYLMATAPESLYELDLDADVALKMEGDACKISENWLASAQPPIPPGVARLLLEDGRMTFNFTRTKNNWRRVKAGLRLLLNLNGWFKHICSWKSRQASLEVVFCIALLCYLPSTACKLFFYLAALTGCYHGLEFKRRLAALMDSGAEAAASLLISPRAAATGGGAAAAAGPAMEAIAAAAGAAGSRGAAEPVGTVADVTIGGGVVDTGSDDEAGEDSKVAVGTVAEFKRKFAELIELGLLLQNLFDDVASILERLQAVMSFQDAVASLLFIVGCILAVLVVALLGFPTTVFLVLLYQVRPPSLRDALPPPPFCYFMKLPCKSAAEFG